MKVTSQREKNGWFSFKPKQKERGGGVFLHLHQSITQSLDFISGNSETVMTRS